MHDFGRIVAMLVHTPKYQNMPLKDLQWLVMPAVTSGQYMLAETKPQLGKPDGLIAAVLLFARVSPEVDKRLVSGQREPLRLQPADWTSGEIARVVDAVGRKDAVEGLMAEFRRRIGVPSASKPKQ